MTPAEKQRRATIKRHAAWDAMPKIPCQCGCGTLIPPITRRWEPAKYAHGHNPGGEATQFQPGSDIGRIGVEARKQQGIFDGAGHPRWKGGVWIDRKGYHRVRISTEEAELWPTHRSSGGGFTIMRSHKVWNEAHPDDFVQRGHRIRHIDRNPSNDAVENLKHVTPADHDAEHAEDRRKRPRDPITGRYY